MSGGSVTPRAPATVWLADPAVASDLRTYLGRAAAVDQDGAVRLVGHGQSLAGYVAPVHGGAGPTVLGLRIAPLAEPSGLDLTAPLTDVLAALAADPAAGPGDPVPLELPAPGPVLATWAGVSPPRSGWTPEGLIPAGTLREAMTAGLVAVVSGTPAGATAAVVAGIRARVWGAPLMPQGLPLPAGLAFAAVALGFLTGDEPASLYRRGAWTRLSTSRGHALARSSLLG